MLRDYSDRLMIGDSPKMQRVIDLVVWDLASGHAEGDPAGHVHAVTACAVTPDGRRVVSAAVDHILKVWDLASGTCKFTHRANAPYLAITATATAIIAGDTARRRLVSPLAVARRSFRLSPRRSAAPTTSPLRPRITSSLCRGRR